ncbi:Hypothetical protein LUCI_0311 [Lucifera butyrica]|uniref:Uncharacterized protein n=1 Tax=Lucifera butyrica TaxID=1351585 RepID=A0A498R1R0_9FIRM|nr:DUF6809 family protein [Lucifera butyrica]VBB05105.1 Hypothetical protein LUCI_0311 [Lucifera butyrica]
MKIILEELYNGNIDPLELIFPKSPEYRPLTQRISDMLEIWEKKLSEDDTNYLKHCWIYMLNPVQWNGIVYIRI